ncbi:MAG TPA: substrate-binding domain-containing protein [Anaerolineales bacterium]|nr:substrate-binding domain-containing protein [Anaerolineales bacterium]
MKRVSGFATVLYGIVSLAVAVAALAVPSFRANAWLAYAPLREWLVPPPEPIVLTLLYSTEKEAWLTETLAAMARDDLRVDGRPIRIEGQPLGSREIVLAVLDGRAQPDLISPASSLQLQILADQSLARNGQALVDLADARHCRPMLETPLVLVAWRDRAEALWGEAPGSALWLDLQARVTDPQGWAGLGQPDWGFIKYGQSDPLRSNSGFMAVVLMTYAYFDKTSGLANQDVLTDASFQAWLAAFQNNAVHPFAQSTGPLMTDMIQIGPSRYDLAAVYEATAIEQAENAVGRYGELRIYYPPATVVSDHPFCLLRAGPAAPWITDEKTRAAEAVLAYLTDVPAQERALIDHGFRPVNPAVSLEQPASPFVRYAANGLQLALPDEVERPPGDVLNTLLELWDRLVS